MPSDELITLLRTLDGESDADFSSPGGNSVRSSSGKSYFCKSTSDGGEQFRGEALSLELFAKAAPGLAPKVFCCKDINGTTHWISEYLDFNGSLSESTSKELATRLAKEVHTFVSEDGFGFPIPSYCGATRFEHGWFPTWAKCYSSLIGELSSLLRAKSSRYSAICQMAEDIQERAVPLLLEPMDVKPVLLHADLWSGNVSIDRQTRRPVVFDPASFYGHNEYDLAIARIFGGFPTVFFERYHECFPKTEPVDQYGARQDLYMAIHYLNHTYLFGGSYEGNARDRMQKVLKFIETTHESGL